MRVYVATTNHGKLRELRALCEPAGWDVRVYELYEAPDEGDASYEANAVLKARALFDQLVAAGEPFDSVIGDDSGIEVAALDGRPGVLSARYGGDNASWSQRRQSLLAEVDRANASRDARFVCVVHLIDSAGRSWTAGGSVAGSLVDAERGDGGFSYDAVFLYEPDQKTFAELGEKRKNEVSHRALAVQRLIAASAASALRAASNPNDASSHGSDASS